MLIKQSIEILLFSLGRNAKFRCRLQIDNRQKHMALNVTDDKGWKEDKWDEYSGSRDKKSEKC